LPRKVTYKIAAFLADLHFLTSKRDRQAIISNLKVILDKRDNIRAITREVFRNFARYLVDFFIFPLVDRDFIEKFVEVENIEYLEDALKKGNGVIALTAHMGSWELGGIVIAQLGYRFKAIALDHKDKQVDEFFKKQRESKGCMVIPLGPLVLKRSLQALKQGNIVAILADRNFSRGSIYVDFFGRPSPLPKGPAVLSLKANCPIVPGFLIRVSIDKFKLIFERPIEPAPSGDLDSDIKRVTRQFISVIEKYARKYPEQWFMFKEFWLPETAEPRGE
jgi:KDO2-lipid IV(A) lauroyltransferase